jgi:hypothetical protein
MIVGKVDRPSVNSNEAYRLPLTLTGLLSVVTFEFLSPRRVTEILWYAFPLWYRALFLRKPAVSVIATRSRTGLITEIAAQLMRRHDMHSTTPLLNRGTI